MKNIYSFVTLVILAFVISSCRAPQDIVYLQDLTPDNPLPIPEVQYIKIKPEDKLFVRVHCRDENISKLFNVLGTSTHVSSSYRSSSSSVDMHTYDVDAEGNIEFPVVGTVHVAGLTRQEAGDRIRDVLIEQNLVKDPFVSCSLATAFFYTLGETNHNGQIAIPKDAFTVLEAIAQFGDINLQSIHDKIRVIREEDGMLKTYEIDLTSAEGVLSSPAYYIQPNDIIYVEPNKRRQYSTTALGNSVRTPSFWIGTTSTLISLTLSIWALTKKFQ